MVLVDGDPQQMNELRGALQTYLVNAKFTNCGFHLITLGFMKACSIRKPKDGQPGKEDFDCIVGILLFWLYSFMRPGYCETKDEYEVSKRFLFAWLRSGQVLNILGQGDAHTCREWVRKVLTHENDIVYYQRKTIRTYHQITTSPHEGTNFGIKSHAAAVRPSNTYIKSARALTFQAELKMLQFKHEASRKLTHRPTWCLESETSGHIVNNAQSILQQILGNVQKYTVTRVAEKKWEVVFCVTNRSTESENEEESSESEDYVPSSSSQQKYPNFKRIRRVQLVQRLSAQGQVLDRGHLDCSCCLFQTVGLPCVHQAAVIRHHDASWNGFSHHDVDLEFWNIYHNFAYGEAAESTTVLRDLLQTCRSMCGGASFDVNPPPQATYTAETPTLPAVERITNYPRETIERILQLTSNEYEGLSQNGNVGFSQDENAEGGSMDDFDCDWGELKDPVERHTNYHDLLKNDYHHACKSLDNIYSTDPQLAENLYNELKKSLEDFRDKCRAETAAAEESARIEGGEGNRGRGAAASQRDDTSPTMVHNISGPSGSRGSQRPRRSFHACRANPSKRYKR